MSARGDGGVSLKAKAHTDEKIPKTSEKWSFSKRYSIDRNCSFRAPRRRSELSVMRFFKRIGDKVAAALHFVSRRRRRRTLSTTTTRSSPPPSAAAFSAGRSKPSTSIAALDNIHRAQAINDCIDFINSSSSLHRSNSVPTLSC
ncbi:ubiquitinyl hydrolase 1 [Sarracenia purpurea var. burkii]